MKITKIFMDLDDVCNEFTLQALKESGCDIKPGEYEKYKPEWGFNILKAARELYPYKISEVTPDDFWSHFDQWFWAGLPESKEFKDLLELAEDIVGLENTLILTAPICSPKPLSSISETDTKRWRQITGECLVGKYIWITKHFPSRMHNNFAMCPVKRLCAAPDTLLIDDSDKNVNEFRAAGGQAILMPRPWNTQHDFNCAPMEYIWSQTSKILQA